MKPKMKREVAIVDIMPTARAIVFFASVDALNDFGSFGTLYRDTDRGNDCHWLKVDGRYDFQEVVDYISNYGAKS